MWIIVFLVAVVLLVLLIVWLTHGKRLVKKAMKESLIVYGAKGKGKSLLFSYMAKNCKNGYVSNVNLGGSCKVVNLDKISVAPNTYENTIKGNFYKIKKLPFEDKPIFLDDCAVYLPNYADSQLKKLYPSMPIAYATWRHLYNAPIYLNCQTLQRTWKPLREQADTFIRCRGVLKLPFFLMVRFTYYDNQNSAENNLLPCSSRFLNKYSKAEADQYRATNGYISNGFVFVRKKSISYDSRYFHKKFFGRKSPTS